MLVLASYALARILSGQLPPRIRCNGSGKAGQAWFDLCRQSGSNRFISTCVKLFPFKYPRFKKNRTQSPGLTSYEKTKFLLRFTDLNRLSGIVPTYTNFYQAHILLDAAPTVKPGHNKHLYPVEEKAQATPTETSSTNLFSSSCASPGRYRGS